MAGRLGNLLAVLCSLVMLGGCGSDSSSDSSLVASSIPQNGTSIHSYRVDTMEVVVRKDLDPATVNGATVTLGGRNNFTGRPIVVAGVVNYNARTRKITFAPAWQYVDNGSFTLKLAGLKDAAGNLLPEATISFTADRWRWRLAAFGLAAVNSDGSPGGNYDRTVFDADANSDRTIRCNGAGPDGAWFTSDDQIDFYRDSSFDPANKISRSVTHRSAGPDGIWLTADDPVDSYSVATYDDGKEIEVSYNGAGGDGVWFNTDDAVSAYTATTYNPDGSMNSMIQYAGSGPDGRWFTADDVYQSYFTFLHDANGNETRRAFSGGAGPDGVPFSADDSGPSTSPGVSYEAITYDTNNRTLSRTVYNDPGPDGVWFTLDDVYRYYITNLYDADGRLVRSASSRGAGADGIPFTVDDSYLTVEVSTDGSTLNQVRTSIGAVIYEGYSYDAEGNLLRSVDYEDPGPDGVWFTADDKILNSTTFTLNAAGKPARRIIYGGAGPDGVWFTDDDLFNGHYTDYSYDTGGNEVQTVDFFSGPDSVPFTADDQAYSYRVSTYDANSGISSEAEYYSGPDGVLFTADDWLMMKYEVGFPPANP